MNKEKLEQKLIDFEGGQILGFKTEDGQIWMGVRKTCIDIGLTEDQAKRQVKNLKEDIVLSQGVSNLTLPTNGGEQQVFVIKEDLVTLWLAKISLTPKMQKENPKAVEKLITYQVKASKVLHNAFMGTIEKKQEFYNDMELKGEFVELKGTINSLESKISEMDKTMGVLILSATINSYQAKQLNKLVRERVSTMLGGAHSPKYKKESRMYFKNLWLGLCDTFQVSEYRDLNPLNFNDAVTYINNWSMVN